MAPTYQTCGACGAVQYFRRPFCATCGAEDLAEAQAEGRGEIAAASLLHRAPSREMADRVPYEIVLVDLPEGFRVMAHGPGGCVPGQAVTLSEDADGLLRATKTEGRA